MVKIPVQKTVLRNGKPHLQTYWEESYPEQRKKTGLSSLSVKLPAKDHATDNPVRKAWERSRLIPQENRARHSVDIEACIAAGFTPEASIYLQSYVVGDDHSLADYIYDNGLDHMPHPRNGWKFTSLGQDHRSAWIRAIEENGSTITMEQAIEWSDAGFDYPWSGISTLIQMGVSSERAKEWEADAGMTGLSVGVHLYLYKDELLSDMSLDEARIWRKAMKQTTSLSPRQIMFNAMGFKPEEAARWESILYYDVPAESANQLRDQKWSPTALKTALREVPGSRGSDKLTSAFADEILRATPRVGSTKVVREWMAVVQEAFIKGFDAPGAVESVVACEAWKKEAERLTGTAIPSDCNHVIASLHSKQREAYIEVMTTPGRDKDKSKYAAVRGMDMAKMVGSGENARYLKEQGFPLGSIATGVVHALSHPDPVHLHFDVASAAPAERDKWLRSVAVSLYWRNTMEHQISRSDMRDMVNNEAIDPILLKDALLEHRGSISPVQLEGVILSDISAPVLEGWL